MRINIHSCGKISVAHHLLDKLDIVRAFAEPRAECVSHVMYAKMRQQFRLTIFQFSLIHFFGVVGDGDTLDGPIDIMGTEKVFWGCLTPYVQQMKYIVGKNILIFLNMPPRS